MSGFMLTKILAAAALVLAACAADPEPQPEPADDTASLSETPAPDIGEACGENDACALGLSCITYYGVAGSSGPATKTCEIKCKGDSDCPADYTCMTLADGPGRVCRQ